MKEITKKFLSIAFSTAFMLGMAVVAYNTVHQKAFLSASLLDGLDPGDINAVEFVSPKGYAYPINNVVTITSVFVDTTTTDGNVSGSDLENSFITFAVTAGDPCPVGTVYSNNQIILPDSFTGDCTVQIEIAGTKKSTEDLTIQAISCANFQTSILRSYGAGFEYIDPANWGIASSTPTGFNFGVVGNAVDSIDLNYPSTNVSGAKTFQIHLDFVPDVSVDVINGIDAKAKIISNNGNGVYSIKVRSEGTGSEVQTALNFAYVFNDLLGVNSPFLAYPKVSDPKQVILQATEMGSHGDSYTCLVDGAQVNNCFTGGQPGQGEAAGVLTKPLKLDNKVIQGDSNIVFADKSAGEIQWISSHPSILEVSTLSEANKKSDSTVDFVDKQLSAAEAKDQANGGYNIDCEAKTDANNNWISETCDTTVTIPVSYNITGLSYTANVTIDGILVPVTVQGTQLNGTLQGSASYSSGGGAGYSLTGNVTGTVTGTIAGQYSGTVTGQIIAPIQASATLQAQGIQITPTAFTDVNKFIISTVTEGVLTEVVGTFVSTVKKQDDDVSHVAMIFAKRPGVSILSAMDKQGCIASFDVKVIEKKVILQMVGKQAGDVLDVSETLQINAYTGGADASVDEFKNITASSGMEWFSSNPDVASIDATGLLTALKPGATNITARFDTGDAEIGTIESIPLQVVVNKISKLRVTFDKATENKLPDVLVKDAHKSVMIAVHNPSAAGQTLVVEGQNVAITLPAGTYANDIARVTAIAQCLKARIGGGVAADCNEEADPPGLNNSTRQKIVNVTTIDGAPGILVLQPLNQSSDVDGDKIEDIDENGMIDVDTTTLEKDLSILPTYENDIPLPASESYSMRVIVQYDNGATKLLPPTQFKWVNSPVNYLEQAALDTGILKLGQISGTSTVLAEYQNADGSVVQSNYLIITVDSGPAIEYVRRIGSGSITKGMRINLQAKITDVNSISDIKSITTSLVYSNFNTYNKINVDPGAIWFSATPFVEEVKVVEVSPVVPLATPAGGPVPPVVPIPQTPALPSLKYKIYDIPVEVPVDQNLFDGLYKLILTISDTENHTLNYVFPIRIGQIGAGDVNGDGVTNMIDVILTFQIASGLLPGPTPAQLLAANVDGIGGVTLVDVILLFNKVTNK